MASTLFGPAGAFTLGADVPSDPTDVIIVDLALAGVQPGERSLCPGTSGDSRSTTVAGRFVGSVTSGH